MNEKIYNYVNVLFTDIPRSKKTEDLKEEILSNMSERFEDYIQKGKTENQAYSLVISSLGDIDEMLADVTPNDEFYEGADYFRNRNAILTAIAVSMYIIGAAFLIGLGAMAIFLNENTYAFAGLIVMLIIIAVSTGALIYKNMSTPLEYKEFKREKNNIKLHSTSKHSNRIEKIIEIYWIIVTFVYLVLSFITGLWAITWLIWILASIFPIILNLIFDKKHGEYK